MQLIPPHITTTLYLYAMRYAMGRMSAAPSDFKEALYWGLNNGTIPEGIIDLLRRDLDEEFKRQERWESSNPHNDDRRTDVGPLGWSCDVETWKSVRRMLREITGPELEE